MNNDRFKFRVWDIRNGEYFKDPNPTPPLNSDGTLGFTYDKPNFQKYYIIEQCTGLKDKNGNLIYEGDIVQTPTGEYLIMWIISGFKAVPQHKMGGILEEITILDSSIIIGNIHKPKENQ